MYFRSSWWCMRWLLARVTSVMEDNYNGDWDHGQKRLLYLSEGNIFLRIRRGRSRRQRENFEENKKRAEREEEKQKVTLNSDRAENQTVFFSALRTWTVDTARKHPSEEMKHRSGRFGQHSQTHFELWQQPLFSTPWMKKRKRKISVNVLVVYREQASENMFLGGGSAPTGNDCLSHGGRYFSETLSFNLHSIHALFVRFQHIYTTADTETIKAFLRKFTGDFKLN